MVRQSKAHSRSGLVCQKPVIDDSAIIPYGGGTVNARIRGGIDEPKPTQAWPAPTGAASAADYYRRLREAIQEGTEHLSSSALAQAVGVSDTQVRKDLSHLDLYGQSGAGYDVVEMAAFLIERYYPDLIPHLAPIVSPMIAHGRYLKQAYGPEAFVVFIGPCIAKKGEIAEPAVAGAVDAALTFGELEAWLDEGAVSFPPPKPLDPLPQTLVTMMQRPQLATALAGGLIALGLSLGLKHLQREI